MGTRWLAVGLLALAYGCATTAPSTYSNPVLTGFHADPSVARVGGDYYLVTSSFEYFPGVPVYHSRDLVHWRQVGYALTRESQLKLAGQKASKGIFAPTIRWHDGTFYMVTTNIENGGSFYVTTKDPAGEWSDPVWVGEKGFSMDPSLLFDDDGKVYYTRHGGGRNGGVYQSEIDVATGRLAAEPRLVWAGTGGIWPEGPHLYKVDDTYYLLISEGGTSYNHSLTVARSKSPWGPFEPDPANPILTHRDRPDLPLQAVGHGDLVQTEEGAWWLVLLGIRPVNRRHHIGRETLLAPVTWDGGGWPHVNHDQPLALAMTGAGLPASHPWPAEEVRDDFDGPRLALAWERLRTNGDGLWSLTEQPGMLRLKGTHDTLDDVATPAFVARRQEHLRMHASTRLQFTPSGPAQAAGLVLRQDEANHYEVRVTGVPRRVELVTRISGASTVVRAVSIPEGDVTLAVDAFPDRYEFAYAVGNAAPATLGSAPTEPLSSERTGGFTGVFVGMYAAGEDNMPPADFDWFDYAPLGD
jgi:alpha-N-arabinofuranosidase